MGARLGRSEILFETVFGTALARTTIAPCIDEIRFQLLTEKMSNIPTPDQIESTRAEAEKLIANLRASYLSQSDQNTKISWDMQRSISNYLVLGSGAALIFVGNLFQSGASEAQYSSLLTSGILYFISLGLSLFSIWFRSIAIGNLAVSQAEFASQNEQYIRTVQAKFEVGDLSRTDASPPKTPSAPFWQFNLWEITSFIVVLIWLLASGFLAFALVANSMDRDSQAARPSAIENTSE